MLKDELTMKINPNNNTTEIDSISHRRGVLFRDPLRRTVRLLLLAGLTALAMLLVSYLIHIPDAAARPLMGVRMTSQQARRFPEPYGYGITVTYALEYFDENIYAILDYDVQVDEGNGEWRTTHSQRPAKYDWANIHGKVKCNADLYNLPSGAGVQIRVRAHYRFKNTEFEEDRWTRWSEPISATVDTWGCPGGTDTTNSCVVDVLNQVNAPENHSPGNLSLYTEVPGGDWGNAEDAKIRPYWYAMGASQCHIQGFARTRNGTLVWTANSKGFGTGFNECAGGAGNGYGSHLFLGGITGDRPNFPQLRSDTEGGDSGLITANIPLSDSWYHPGGIQAIGQHVIVGMDSGSTPYNAVKIFKVGAYGVTEINSVLVPTKAQSVGIVDEADGRYLVTVGSSSSKVIDFYRTTGTNLADSLMHVGRWEWADEGFADGSIDGKHIDYQNINPVRECGTNKLFLLATGREGTWFDGGEFTGHDYVHVFEVLSPIQDDPQYPQYEIEIKKAARRHFYMDDGNWTAGGSSFITDDGGLHFYGMEHGFTPVQCTRGRATYPHCNPDEPSIFRIQFDELW
jgi:hypothetical protein